MALMGGDPRGTGPMGGGLRGGRDMLYNFPNFTAVAEKTMNKKKIQTSAQIPRMSDVLKGLHGSLDPGGLHLNTSLNSVSF